MSTEHAGPATPRQVVDGVIAKLPAQVTTLTHESGATVPVRIMDGNAEPTAARIAVRLLWLLAERCPWDTGDAGCWYETDLRELAFKIGAEFDVDAR